ncbi:MAG: transporter permease [Rhodospirillales bacterium]|nr:transporter permease [Rhodospirillales bacterium]
MSADIGQPARIRSPLLAVHPSTWRTIFAMAAGLGVTALLILSVGADPLTAYRTIALGAFGSLERVTYGLNRATPYILCGIGVSLCFRAKVINIGGEGQIAIGGLCATWVALTWPIANPAIAIGSAALGGIAGGMIWASLAGGIHLGRGVNEVLVTLLMNFIAVLLVAEALHSWIGEIGAGFPQSPMLTANYRLPKLIAGTDLHIGILFALVAAILANIVLWCTSLGFAWRIFGESRMAARYAGFSRGRLTIGVMALAGGLAGLAGAIEVMGIHYRLIEGFSKGFGFNAIAVALLAALKPWAVIPAGLFFGFLETGTQAMQRQIGVPSSLVIVIQGVTMLLVLAAMGGLRPKGGS